MKKQLLLTVAIAILAGTTLGCSQNKNANQPTTQEVKKELSNEEIVKTALNNFPKEKNLELDTKVNIKSNFMAEGYSVNVLSNIKIDDSGNVLKKFSEQETELGKTTTKEEHIFLKKNNSGYDKFNVKNGKLVPDTITDDLEVLSAIQVFFNGNTLFNTITDKNYEKSEEKIYNILCKKGDENKAIQRAREKYYQVRKEYSQPSKMMGCTTVYKWVEELKKKIGKE